MPIRTFFIPIEYLVMLIIMVMCVIVFVMVFMSVDMASESGVALTLATATEHGAEPRLDNTITWKSQGP